MKNLIIPYPAWALLIIILCAVNLPLSTFAQQGTLPEEEAEMEMISDSITPEASFAEEVDGEISFPTVVSSDSVWFDFPYPTWLWWLALTILFLALILFVRAFYQVREDPARTWQRKRSIILLLLAAFLIMGLLLYTFVLANNKTRVRKGNCEVGSELKVAVLGPRGQKLANKYFNSIKPGIRVESNSYLVVQSRKTYVLKPPGALTVTIYRGADGRAEHGKISGRVEHKKGLRKLLKKKFQSMPAPTGMSKTNDKKVERIRVVVYWKPDNHSEGCTYEDEIQVVWRFNSSGKDASWAPLNPGKLGKPPKSKSKTLFSPEILPETTGYPGDTNYSTPTVVMFSVKDGFKCCGVKGKQYAIIQFVRHRWKLGNGLVRQDRINLDGSSSQAVNHQAGRPYDPTYAKSGSPLFQVGPWPKASGDAISVKDYPGLLSRDHDRFRRLGGVMQWEFWTLLVCEETPATAQQYLANGSVESIAYFRVVRVYDGGGKEPKVGAEPYKDGNVHFKTCAKLSQILQDSGWTDAFNNPRPHVIRFGG